MNHLLTGTKKILALMLSVAAVLILVSCGTATTTPANSNIPAEINQYTNDWPLPNKDFANTRATTNSAINSGNVKTLGVAWAVPLSGQGIYGGASTGPIIMGDTAYIQDLSNNIFAIDIATGAIKWQALFNSSNIGPNGIAAGYGKIFGSSDPYNIVALDMKTGKQIWQTQVSTQPTTGVDIQPGVYGNLVFISTVPGTSGGDFYSGGGSGSIYALDQATGKIKWSFDTVDSANIWGNAAVNSGGGAWYTPAIDTAAGTMFWGIGNPAPWPGTADFPNGSSRPGPNLYTNSMVALDPASGSLKWYSQVKPHDLFDADFQISPVLASATVNGTTQDIVIGAGKLGNVVAFNRNTGAVLWSTPVGKHQNDNLAEVPAGKTVQVYPGYLGGVETPMAYAKGKIFASVVNVYTEYSPTSVTGVESFAKGTGDFVAIDVNTGKILWDNSLKMPGFAGATVINDLVFTATFDGMMYAYNIDTGAQVWSWQAPGPVNAWPSAAGDTLLVPVGLATPFPVLIALKPGATAPTLTMLPLNEQSVETGNVTVSAMAFNTTLVNKIGQANVSSESHLLYFMDRDPIASPGQPAIPATGAYGVSANTTWTFSNVAPGTHTFSVELVNNDNTALNPVVSSKVTVTVTSPVPKITIVTPANQSSLPPGDVTITVGVNNFTLGNSTANADGQGHLVYYMDVVAPTKPGEAAVTTAGTYAAAAATSYTWNNVPAGTHTFSVELVNNDGTPLSTPLVAKIVIRVGTGSSGVGP